MAPIVTLESALAYLGIADDDPLAGTVSGMLDAMSDEIRTLANRALEGDGADYDLVLRIYRQPEFMLPKVPVDVDRPITITPVLFDGTELTELEATQWRLEDPATGRIRIVASIARANAGGDALQRGPTPRTRYDPAPDYVHVTWSTTGAISASLTFAMLEWLKTRWASQDVAPHLAGYATGKDAEQYFQGLIGAVPPAVSRALISAWHPANGGVI